MEILAEHVFDCGDIVGKVFDDLNGNGHQDAGEPGLAGVRVATAKGWLVTTDRHGRFHVACAALPDARIGSNFIMKLDTRTLPTGYRMTTENPRVVRLTAGKMTEIAFGASLGRVVRLDLHDEAFLPGSVELHPAWRAKLDKLIDTLSVNTVLSLRYAAPADTALARKRLAHIKALAERGARRENLASRPAIESRIETGR